MAARRQSPEVMVGAPVMAIAPQLYGLGEATAATAGFDIDTNAAAGVSAVADLAGFGGALVLCYFSPPGGGSPGNVRVSIALYTGDTATASAHTAVDVATFQELGIASSETTHLRSFLVSAEKVSRYLSVRVTFASVSAVFAATVVPLAPQYPPADLGDNKLSATASGTLSFPALIP